MEISENFLSEIKKKNFFAPFVFNKNNIALYLNFRFYSTINKILIICKKPRFYNINYN